MNSVGDKLHTRIVAFDEIYNFVVQFFFHPKSFSNSNNQYSIHISDTDPYPVLGYCHNLCVILVVGTL
jgi:hypothetical protein